MKVRDLPRPEHTLMTRVLVAYGSDVELVWVDDRGEVAAAHGVSMDGHCWERVITTLRLESDARVDH